MPWQRGPNQNGVGFGGFHAVALKMPASLMFRLAVSFVSSVAI